MDLLDQLSFAAHAVEHLQQHGAHELLGRDARPAHPDVGFVHRRELAVHLGQRVVDQPDRPQRVVEKDQSPPASCVVNRLLAGCQLLIVGSLPRRSTSPCWPTRPAASIGDCAWPVRRCHLPRHGTGLASRRVGDDGTMSQLMNRRGGCRPQERFGCLFRLWLCATRIRRSVELLDAKRVSVTSLQKIRHCLALPVDGWRAKTRRRRRRSSLNSLRASWRTSDQSHTPEVGTMFSDSPGGEMQEALKCLAGP